MGEALARRALGAGCLALGLLGCGPGVAADAVTIRIEAMSFVPAMVTVKRGDTVVWTNRDLVAHTATAAGVFASGAIAPGRSWQQVMARGGRFEYACSLHPTMTAVLVVE